MGERIPAGRLRQRDALGDVTVWVRGSTAAQDLRSSRTEHGREQVPVRASCRVVHDRVAADAGLPIGAGIALRPRNALRSLRPLLALRALWTRRTRRPCLVPRECRLARAAATAAARVDHAELPVVDLVAGVDHALVVRNRRVGNARGERERSGGRQNDECLPLHRFLLMARSSARYAAPSCRSRASSLQLTVRSSSPATKNATSSSEARKAPCSPEPMWSTTPRRRRGSESSSRPSGVQIRITNVSTSPIIRMTLKVALRRCRHVHAQPSSVGGPPQSGAPYRLAVMSGSGACRVVFGIAAVLVKLDRRVTARVQRDVRRGARTKPPFPPDDPSGA